MSSQAIGFLFFWFLFLPVCFEDLFYFTWVTVLPACVSVHPCVPGAGGGQKRVMVSDSLNLEFQMVVSLVVGTVVCNAS